MHLRGAGGAPPTAEERDAPVAVVRNEQQADEDRGDDEPPDNTDADEADGCGLVPNNLLWI